MLIDIQINTATILRENKSIRSEMTDLERTIQQQKDDITATKTSLEHTTKQYNEAERELAVARKKIQEQEEEIGDLYDLHDKLEQYTRKNSRKIFRTAPYINYACASLSLRTITYSHVFCLYAL